MNFSTPGRGSGFSCYLEGHAGTYPAETIGPTAKSSLGMAVCREHASFFLYFGTLSKQPGLLESGTGGSCRTRAGGHRLLWDSAVGTAKEAPLSCLT